MKHSIIIFILSICISVTHGQSTKEEDFVKTIKKVVSALSKRDSVGLSRYIDKKTGVYLLYRIGVRDAYSHYSALGFSDTTYPNAPFYDNIKLTSLKYSKLPYFDCKKWTKTGTFVDTTKIDHLLSNTAKWLNKNFQDKIPLNTIKIFYDLEAKSRRVVIAVNNWNELIFYLSYINNKWKLTIIDKLTCDCSV